MTSKDARLVVYRRRLTPRNQRWRWRLVAANGKKLANGGEGFSDRDYCIAIARSVIGGQYGLANVEIAGDKQ